MEITFKNFQKKVLIPRTKIIRAVKAASRKLNSDVYHLISIVFVGTKRMRSINKKYLGHGYATDVLTFDLGENSGEIIICPQIANAQARRYRTSAEKEIIRYVIHGLLHLAGYDDKSPRDLVRMRRMESELMGSS